MAQPRVRLKGGFYHVTSRTVDGAFFLEDKAVQAKLLHTMRAAEAFCGVSVLTYVHMSNHVHYLLVENAPYADPKKPEEWPDELVLGRIQRLKGKKKTKILRARWERWREQGLDAAVEEAKAKFIGRMNNVSAFMKIVKQEVAQWYNKTHKRKGHFWGSRFDSVLVQGHHNFLLTVAAYIELNPVRAGMVDDPKDYPHSSYGAAVGGDGLARGRIEEMFDQSGILRLGTLAGEEGWKHISKRYRKALFRHGVKKMDRYGNPKKGRAGFTAEEIIKVLEADGTLSWSQMVRPRLNYMVHGVVLGNKPFVASVTDWTRQVLGAVRDRVPILTGIEGMCAFRGVGPVTDVAAGPS